MPCRGLTGGQAAVFRDPRACDRVVNQRRGLFPQRRTRALVVVAGDIRRQPEQRLGTARVVLEVDVLVSDRAPGRSTRMLHDAFADFGSANEIGPGFYCRRDRGDAAAPAHSAWTKRPR